VHDQRRTQQLNDNPDDVCGRLAIGRDQNLRTVDRQRRRGFSRSPTGPQPPRSSIASILPRILMP
jgi:hypothetical protein